MQTQTVSFQVPTQYIHEFKDILHVISKSMKFDIKELDENKKSHTTKRKKSILQTLEVRLLVVKMPKKSIKNIEMKNMENRIFIDTNMQQYISAKNSNCSKIITNDKNFPKLDLPLIRTNPDIEDYLLDS